MAIYTRTGRRIEAITGYGEYPGQGAYVRVRFPDGGKGQYKVSALNSSYPAEIMDAINGWAGKGLLEPLTPVDLTSEPLYAAAYGDEPPPGYVIDPEDGAWYRVEMRSEASQRYDPYREAWKRYEDDPVTPGEMALALAAGETEVQRNLRKSNELAAMLDTRIPDLPADTEREERIEALREAQEHLRKAAQLVSDSCEMLDTDEFRKALGWALGETKALIEVYESEED